MDTTVTLDPRRFEIVTTDVGARIRSSGETRETVCARPAALASGLATPSSWLLSELCHRLFQVVARLRGLVDRLDSPITQPTSGGQIGPTKERVQVTPALNQLWKQAGASLRKGDRYTAGKDLDIAIELLNITEHADFDERSAPWT